MANCVGPPMVNTVRRIAESCDGDDVTQQRPKNTVWAHMIAGTNVCAKRVTAANEAPEMV